MRLIDGDTLALFLVEKGQRDIKRFKLGELIKYTPSEVGELIKEMPTIELVKWIPVSEWLPIPNSVYEDVFVYYLVQNEYGDMMVATFVQFPGGARVWQQMYQDGAIMEDIVAWRPLPTPWKGEEG